MNKTSPRIGLVYLNRKAEGDAPVRRFIESYKKHDSGIRHEFITIYKGFDSGEKDAAALLFHGIEHRRVDVDDEMTDIDSYLIAADCFADVDVFCFLNTFSEIACDNWLAILFNALAGENVGIAGATASYESLLDSCRLVSKVIWLCDNGFLKYDTEIHLQYKTVIDKQVPRWAGKNTAFRLFSKFSRKAPEHASLNMYDDMFEKFWESLTGPDGVYHFLKTYPPFPNPHIRSNGFIVKRNRLTPFLGERRRMSKKDSYLFESGSEGLTRRVLDNHLRAVVVNNRGEVFDVGDWPRSGTFRLDSQQGLLIHDNQTRNFQSFNSAEQRVYTRMTWGDSSERNRGHVCTFGIPFELAGSQILKRGVKYESNHFSGRFGDAHQ